MGKKKRRRRGKKVHTHEHTHNEMSFLYFNHLLIALIGIIYADWGQAYVVRCSSISIYGEYVDLVPPELILQLNLQLR